jgi:chemotaxis protein methyltransferase CheR
MQIFGELPTIREDEFAHFQRLIATASGIALGPNKKMLLISRLAPRMRALGVRSFSEYYQMVTAPDGEAELTQMLDCICTNETRFFREPRQFEFLRGGLIDELCHGRPRRLRVWSAGCSTGEEPYSIAMTLVHHLPASCFSLEIVGSDLSTRALDHARRAIWPIARAEEIPLAYFQNYMLRGTGPQQGNMRVGPEIRKIVSFTRDNLARPMPPRLGMFDIIFFRNVLIYFNAETRAAILSRILGWLNPHGYLFLGHAESLGGVTDQMETIMPAVYRWKQPGQ